MNDLKNLQSFTVMLHVVDFELCCPSGQLSQTSGLCLKLAKADSGIQVVFEIRNPFRVAVSSKWYLRKGALSGLLSQASGF